MRRDHRSATEETELSPSPAEVRRGEGMTLRRVQLTVERVLWSRAGAAPLPTSVRWTAFGDYFHGGIDRRSRMGAYDSSRLEVGHSYLVAVHDLGGADGGASRWVPLGGAAQLPFDQGVLGHGEFEGRLLGRPDPVLGREIVSSSVDDGVLETAAGARAPQVVSLLRAAARSEPSSRRSGCT